jgi:hypothetical protein
MTERSKQITIAALQRAITDSTRPEKIRRACALRLSRLRAATTASAKRPAPTTRTTPAAPTAPSAQACFEAHQSFTALAAQRSALHRKRRSPGEQEIFKAMLALMPAAAPTNDDPKAWTNFVAQIDGLLSEIKNIKQP